MLNEAEDLVIFRTNKVTVIITDLIEHREYANVSY